MDLSFNKHFHSLNKTVFAVGKKRSSVLPDKSSCPVYITGSCGNTENIGFRNYQYLAFIVRRQQEKVAGFYDREGIAHIFDQDNVTAGFHRCCQFTGTCVQVSHSSNDDQPGIRMIYPETVKCPDQSLMTFFRGKTAYIDKLAITAVQDFLKFFNGNSGLCIFIKDKWFFRFRTNEIKIHIIGNDLDFSGCPPIRSAAPLISSPTGIT